MKDPVAMYLAERDAQIKENRNNYELDLERATHKFTEHLVRSNYVKNFSWKGIPIMQYPSDLMVMQEIIYEVCPTVIIETGIAFGGMTQFYSDMVWNGEVISIDIDIRKHARENLACLDKVTLLEGSSIEEWVHKTVLEWAKKQKVLVSLDSNHTHEHVFKELELYAPLVSVGSYIVVFDTAIHFYGHLDKNQDRPWNKQSNPWTAVQEFLKTDMGKNFMVDKDIEVRALLTAAPGGWLKRIR
jgi:cephalosporin hydroxylase